MAKNIDFLEKVFLLSASPAEAAAFGCTPNWLWEGFWQRIEIARGTAPSFSGSDPLRKQVAHARRFYHLADQRSHMMLNNFLRLMDKKHSSRGVLITGGFHTAAILRELRQAKVRTWRIILPQITASAYNNYFERLVRTPAETGREFSAFPACLSPPLLCQRKYHQEVKSWLRIYNAAARLLLQRARDGVYNLATDNAPSIQVSLTTEPAGSRPEQKLLSYAQRMVAFFSPNQKLSRMSKQITEERSRKAFPFSLPQGNVRYMQPGEENRLVETHMRAFENYPLPGFLPQDKTLRVLIEHPVLAAMAKQLVKQTAKAGDTFCLVYEHPKTHEAAGFIILSRYTDYFGASTYSDSLQGLVFFTALARAFWGYGRRTNLKSALDLLSAHVAYSKQDLSILNQRHAQYMYQPHVHVGGFFVDPAYQGQGVGSELLEATRSLAEQMGLPLYLETQTVPNSRFYENRGYRTMMIDPLPFTQAQNWAMIHPGQSMSGRVVVVTGASSGIGFELVRGLLNLGATVVVGNRPGEKSRRAMKELRKHAALPQQLMEFPLDVASQASVRDFAQTFNRQFTRLDVLINNAGAVFDDFQLTGDGVERTMAVDYIGPWSLTNLLLPVIKATPGARIINTASEAHRFGTGFSAHLRDFFAQSPRRVMPWWSLRQYATVKFFLIQFAWRLKLLLQAEGYDIPVYAVDPGKVATPFAQTNKNPVWRWMLKVFKPSMISPQQASLMLLTLASHPSALKGFYFADKKPQRPAQAAFNIESGRALWRSTEELTGIHYAVSSPLKIPELGICAQIPAQSVPQANSLPPRFMLASHAWGQLGGLALSLSNAILVHHLHRQGRENLGLEPDITQALTQKLLGLSQRLNLSLPPMAVVISALPGPGPLRLSRYLGVHRRIYREGQEVLRIQLPAWIAAFGGQGNLGVAATFRKAALFLVAWHTLTDAWEHNFDPRKPSRFLLRVFNTSA
jgi:NAD(P)-dependent dehydrogenase (short-subunit alcohol dehydrogenase family)/GNAT superfamily N-acetyltransferase